MKAVFGILSPVVVGLALMGCPDNDSTLTTPIGGDQVASGGTSGTTAYGNTASLLGNGGGGIPTLLGTGGSAGAGGFAAVPLGNAVDWNTPFVALHADDFRIEAAGKTFLGQTPGATLHSDPGTPNQYTTFERVWTENGVEMRLNVYFGGDGKDWWASEIRIYNGLANGDWLTSSGKRFTSTLGQAFTGDLDLTFSSAQTPGRLVMHGLRLQAFLTPDVCLNATSGYVIEVLYPTIDMTTAPNAGFGAAVRLLDANCVQVADDSAFLYLWSADNPTILSVSASGSSAGLKGLAAGVTTLHVSAQRRSDGVVVAQGTMLVTISAMPGAY